MPSSAGVVAQSHHPWPDRHLVPAEGPGQELQTTD